MFIIIKNGPEDEMEVLSIKEQPDGSAIIELSMTEEENNLLVEYAVIDILKKEIKRAEEQNEQGANGS
jgi:hypothetical protein